MIFEISIKNPEKGSWYWWGLPSEISVAIAVQTAGITIGNCLGAVGTVFIIDKYNWEMSFYISGF